MKKSLCNSDICPLCGKSQWICWTCFLLCSWWRLFGLAVLWFFLLMNKMFLLLKTGFKTVSQCAGIYESVKHAQENEEIFESQCKALTNCISNNVSDAQTSWLQGNQFRIISLSNQVLNPPSSVQSLLSNDYTRLHFNL